MRKIVLLSSLVFIFLLLVACVPQKPLAGQAVAFCSDSDASASTTTFGDVYKQGTVKDSRYGSFTDACKNAATLIEFFCQRNAYAKQSFNCPYGCENGACKQQSVCGNGRVEAGEQCDDGNTVSGDGCSNTCVTERPDLVVDSTSFSLVLNAYTGKEDVTYSAIIKNIGDASTGGYAFGNKFYVDFSNYGFISVKAISAGPLPAGATVKIEGMYSPYDNISTACPGTHILNITLDYLNWVKESDETNNGKQLTVTC